MIKKICRVGEKNEERNEGMKRRERKHYCVLERKREERKKKKKFERKLATRWRIRN